MEHGQEARNDVGSRGATPSIAILGAGVSGLCMGIQLKRAGIESFTIYEKSDRVGGTWLDNAYPGCACDVPSHLYCFSFEPNPGWSRVFSPQAEIQEYLQRCAEKYGLLRHIRFGVEVAAARFDEGERVWRVRTAAGEEIDAQVLVSGTGQLNRPHIPDVPGQSGFEGTQFHSARWDATHRFEGENVAVIGNGASAIQLVPQIAPEVKQLTIFQRSANWIIPRMDRAYTAAEQERFRRFPWLNRAVRYLVWALLEARFFAFFRDSRIARRMETKAKEYLHSVISDPALREALTPDYPVGCKRILISDDYYQALVRPNVEVVTTGIQRITSDGIVTQDGVTRPVDTIVWATGFETTSFLAPMQIEGLEGRKLTDAWQAGAEAYLGIGVAGFPNLFLLYGPNTNLGHNSIIFMIECQVGYVVECVKAIMRERLAYLDVRREAMDRYNERVQKDLQKTAWSAGCTSWYKTESGKVTNNWSGFTTEYWWRSRWPDLRDFERVAR